MRFGQGLIQGLINPQYGSNLHAAGMAMGSLQNRRREEEREQQKVQNEAALQRSQGLLTGNLLGVSNEMLQPSVNAALATGVAPTAVNSMLNQRSKLLEGEQAQQEKLHKQAEDEAVLQMAIQDAEAKGDEEQLQALITKSKTGQDYFKENADPSKRLDIQIKAINLAQKQQDERKQKTLSNIFKAVETSLAQGADYEAIEANAPIEYKSEVRDYLNDRAEHKKKVATIAETEKAFTESELSELIPVVGQETVDFYQKMAKQRPDKANQWLSTRVAAGLEAMREEGKNSDGTPKAPSSWEVDSAKTLVNKMININPFLGSLLNREGVSLSDSQELQLYSLVASWKKTNPDQNLSSAKLEELINQVKEESPTTQAVSSGTISTDALVARRDALHKLQNSGVPK